MGRELTPAELRELLPIYVLDAVEEDERAEIEQYLEHSSDARDEVASLREVTSLLAQPDHDAPGDLWERIEEALAVDPPELDVARRTRSIARRSGGRRLGARWLAAAAVVVTVAALGVTVVLVSRDMSEQEDRIAALTDRLDRGDAGGELVAMIANPDSRMVDLSADDGSASASIVAMPDGRAFLMGEDLPRLQTDRTYQLWAMTGDGTQPTLVSTAVLGPAPGVAAFHAPAATNGFVLTDERAPGVPKSAGYVVAQGRFDGGAATDDH